MQKFGDCFSLLAYKLLPFLACIEGHLEVARQFLVQDRIECGVDSWDAARSHLVRWQTMQLKLLTFVKEEPTVHAK